jgi:hypothetical protein
MVAMATSGYFSMRELCPLYCQKRTCAVQLGMSALGQERTYAAQQKRSLFYHLVGDVLEMHRHVEAHALAVLTLMTS